MKSRLNYFFIVVFSIMILILPFDCYADEDINVQVDGIVVDFQENKPIIIDNRVLVPIRPIFEAMGAVVTWDKDTKTATAVKNIKNYIYDFVGRDDTIYVTFTENSIIYTYHGTVVKNITNYFMDVAAQNINGRIYIPVRYVAYALGYNISWFDQYRIAFIETPNHEINSETYPNTNIPCCKMGISRTIILPDGAINYDIYGIDSLMLKKYEELLKVQGWQLHNITSYITEYEKNGEVVSLAYIDELRSLIIRCQSIIDK